MLVDSHCHLNYLEDSAAEVAAARSAQVCAMLCVAVEQGTMPAVHELALRYPNVWASAGQHPECADADLAWIAPWLSRERIVAVGEMGLDYHHEAAAAGRRRQRHAFATQLELARKHDLPAIVHTRNAVDDTLAIMAEQSDVRGVLHCFTESAAMAEAAIAQGYYISFSGIVTFKNAEALRRVAAAVPMNRLLIETDAPWLAPAPHRGQRNRPALLPHTAAVLADLKRLDVAELASRTTENFETLFGIRVPAT